MYCFSFDTGSECVCVCTHVCMYACMYVCMYVVCECMCVCVCVCERCTCVCVHIYTCVCVWRVRCTWNCCSNKYFKFNKNKTQICKTILDWFGWCLIFGICLYLHPTKSWLELMHAARDIKKSSPGLVSNKKKISMIAQANLRDAREMPIFLVWVWVFPGKDSDFGQNKKPLAEGLVCQSDRSCHQQPEYLYVPYLPLCLLRRVFPVKQVSARCAKNWTSHSLHNWVEGLFLSPISVYISVFKKTVCWMASSVAEATWLTAYSGFSLIHFFPSGRCRRFFPPASKVSSHTQLSCCPRPQSDPAKPGADSRK